MLRSSNPVLSRKDAFTPAGGGQSANGQAQYGQAGYSTVPAGYPGQPGYPGGASTTPIAAQDRMTFDDVIVKTIGMMVVLVASAALSWWYLPASFRMPALLLSMVVGFITVFFVTMRRKVKPAFVFLYAAIEGVFIGLLSAIFERLYEGIVTQAVVGTFVAAGATFAAYKFFNIRVTPKFRKIVTLATIAFGITLLINLVFALGGVHLGLRGIGNFGVLPMLISAVGIVLAVLNLVLDFDYIERGVEMGAPSNESWRAAFGLTVTMVWLYVELLRILSIFRQ